jgi:hypothetical protein
MKHEPRALLGCVVQDLAKQYDALAHEVDVAWETGDPNGILNDADDRMIEIVQAASFLTSRSKSGAAFQIMAAALDARWIAVGSSTDAKAAADRQHRLLYRVMEWLALDDDDLLNARVHAMSAHLDPREYRA